MGPSKQGRSAFAHSVKMLLSALLMLAPFRQPGMALGAVGATQRPVAAVLSLCAVCQAVPAVMLCPPGPRCLRAGSPPLGAAATEALFSPQQFASPPPSRPSFPLSRHSRLSRSPLGGAARAVQPRPSRQVARARPRAFWSLPPRGLG